MPKKDGQNYVDGRFVASALETLEVRNPATEAVIGRVALADAALVSEAVQAARSAQPEWAKKPAIERAVALRKIAAGIRAERVALARTLVAEQGKTQELAQVEVDFTADYIDYTSEWARRIEGEVIPSDRAAEMIFLNWKPLGVVAGILPWNFPFFLIARKAAPALLTGNTIVVKPSSETPLNAVAFAKIVDAVGLPPGVFNLVMGSGASAGESLIEDPNVDLITFTGSVERGKHIMRRAGENLTRVNLELGGKAPAIVLADADLDLAARSIWQSRVINAGQVCNCAEKVFVDERVHDPLIERLKQLFEATRVGDPSETAALDMGPLVSEAACSDVEGRVRRATSDGATLITGGTRIGKRGHFFAPTLLTDVTSNMSIMNDETFGPVLPVQAVAGLDEALTLANSSDYGLTSSVYTRDLDLALRAARELEYGETYINRENFEAMQGFHAGRKNSGIGGADGKHGLMEFVESHVVYIQGR